MNERVSQTAVDIGRSLRELRTRQNLSQAEAASLAGVSARTLRRVEAGATVHARTLEAICRALGWSAQQAKSSPRFVRSRNENVRYCLHTPEDTIWYAAMDSRKRRPEDDQDRIQHASERRRLGHLGLVGMFFGTLRFTLPGGPGIVFFEIYRGMPIGGENAAYHGLFLYCLRGEALISFQDEVVPLSTGAAIDVGDEPIEIRPAQVIGEDEEAPIVMHVGYGWVPSSPGR